MGNVQGEHGGVKALVSVACDDVPEDDANIGCSMFANPSKLSWVEEVVGDAIKLEALGKDFGEEFAQSVEQGNGAKSFGQVISFFLGFGDDDRVRRFELR